VTVATSTARSLRGAAMTADKERTKPKVVVENFMVIIIMIDSGGGGGGGSGDSE
jgi:hypothetical protein